MRNWIISSVLSTAIAVCAMQTARAEVTVTLSKMHICCKSCVKAIEEAVGKVDGASVKVDADAETAVVTAPDAKVARQTIASIARAGFHAESDHQKLKSPDNSGVKEGKVKRLELVGAHNCCDGCNDAIQEALSKVDGVVSDTAKPKSKTFVVEGDFDGLAVVQALNKAGFHVRSKEAAEAQKKAFEAQKKAAVKTDK